ncbi:hypothetical protein K438DRAFT_1861574 [Mycena galopus ATCC 62051]|nr:hypothetical protein K438DRAFT_1861574 [Mycena galopus ATCC 62051]
MRSQRATPQRAQPSHRSQHWHRLALPADFFLKNTTQKNSLVTVPLDVALVPFQQVKMLINDFAPDDWVGAWSSSAFDVAVRQRTSSGMVWDAWDKDKGYCQPCPTKFLDEHVQRWLLKERVRGRVGVTGELLVLADSRISFDFIGTDERAGTATIVGRWCTSGRMRMGRMRICFLSCLHVSPFLSVFLRLYPLHLRPSVLLYSSLAPFSLVRYPSSGDERHLTKFAASVRADQGGFVFTEAWGCLTAWGRQDGPIVRERNF